MIRQFIFIWLGVFLGACAAQTPAPTSTLLPTVSLIPGEMATITPSPVPPTSTLSPTALLLSSSTPGPLVCSPMENVQISNLAEMIVNPYAPPRLGSDDPHQGVDIADVGPAYQIALAGRPVQAVLTGKVAAIINDRFPYGYAIW